MIPSSKRAVARHACLACREKKVKCDGEVPVPPGEKQIELKTQRCSNCKAANTQCIFVRSQRGGRRKKDHSKTVEYGAQLLPQQNSESLNELPVNFQSTSNGSNSAISSTTPPPHISQKDQFQNQQADIQGYTHQRGVINHDYYHSTTHRPNSQENEIPVSSQHQLNQAPNQSHPMVQNFTYPWVNPVNHINQVNQTTLISNSQQIPSNNNITIPTNHSGSFSYSQGTQQQPQIMSLQQQIPQDQGSSISPILQQRSNSSQISTTKISPQYSSYPSFSQSTNGFVSSIPTVQSPNLMKRSLTTEHDYISIHGSSKLLKSEEFIRISDAELAKFELPDWKTSCLLIDLYYRYIHPSRPFLPPKSRLVYQLQVREDAALLHAVFSCSSRYASSIEIPDPKLRDPQTWYFLAEKYWDLLDLESSLQALVLLMGALGPGGYVQQSIEGSEKFLTKLQVNDFLSTLYIKDWEAYAVCATKKQVARYEDMLRSVWGSWKLNAFLRINRGFPFTKISDSFVEFSPNLPFPLSDDLYNSNLKIFTNTDSSSILKLQYRNWIDIEKDLKLYEKGSIDHSGFTDSSLIIIAIKLMEDVMDTISKAMLNSTTISEFNNKIKTVEDIANKSLYQVSDIKKKMIVINISRLFSLFIVRVAKLVTNVTQCAQILLIKPHETNSNSDPDDVFNSLYESKLETINLAINSITKEQLNHYFTAFNAALEAVKLIEIGMGNVPEEINSLIPVQVIGGPSTFTAASEISSMEVTENWWTTAIPDIGQTPSAQVSQFNEFPDVWIQYPIFSVVVIANALTVLASSMILTKFFQINEINSTNETKQNSSKKNFEITINSNQRKIPIQLDETEYQTCIDSFNAVTLRENLRLCSKYIQAQGRFWPYVEAISTQAEAIIAHIDEIMIRLGTGRNGGVNGGFSLFV